MASIDLKHGWPRRSALLLVAQVHGRRVQQAIDAGAYPSVGAHAVVHARSGASAVEQVVELPSVPGPAVEQDD